MLALVVSGCADRTTFETPPPNLAQVEADIRAADAQWLAAVKSRNVEKTISYWSDDATIFAPGEAPIKGKKAIREYVTGAFASPDFSIIWETESIVVAQAGDMAYQTGTDQMTFRGPDQKLVKMKTRGVVVWRKQVDGSWKAAVDIWNAGTE